MQMMRGFMFDFSVNLGNLLTIVAFIGGGLWFIVLMRNSINLLDKRMEYMEASNDDQNKEIKKLADILVSQAVQDTRLDNMDQRLLAEGRRLDDLTGRFNMRLDANQVRHTP